MEEYSPWTGNKFQKKDLVYRIIEFFWYNDTIFKIEDVKYEKYSTF